MPTNSASGSASGAGNVTSSSSTTSSSAAKATVNAANGLVVNGGVAGAVLIAALAMV